MELNWDNATQWQVAANKGKEVYDEPKWGFDCGFKLDFDGSLLSISSRFYGPNKNTGDWWEGALHVNFLGQEILKKEFKCDTIDELKIEVEKFAVEYANAALVKLSS